MSDLTKSVNSGGRETEKKKKKNKYFAVDPGPRAAEQALIDKIAAVRKQKQLIS